MRTKLLTAAAAAITCALVTPAAAQQPARAIVSIYHAAPGHQIELLKWLANQDRAATAAGVGRAQLYVHTDGDSWDYLMIAPARHRGGRPRVDRSSQAYFEPHRYLRAGPDERGGSPGRFRRKITTDAWCGA
jgi:membrane-bound lytic murein transglycosylase B